MPTPSISARVSNTDILLGIYSEVGGEDGLEPSNPEGADLQSAVITN